MVVKYSEGPLNIPTLYVPRPNKIYPIRDFWFENIPSGNPDPNENNPLLMLDEIELNESLPRKRKKVKQFAEFETMTTFWHH
jgi:hypothetical protein